MGSINVVTHNLQGMFSDRQLGIVGTRKKKSTEKLSSGYKINRAADDAAGLTISENMRRMIRGLTQASANVQDGVSLCQVADGYLDEVHDMLHRMTELSVKGANGTLTDEDRNAINEEIDALKSEMRRIFNVANFNEIPLFHVPYTPEIKPPATDMELFHVGTGNTVGGLEFNNVRYNISELQSKGLKIDDSGVATEDFEASFDLWDGETVDISMKEDDTLAKAKRNYKWTVDENGISINNKFAADWAHITGPDGNPVSNTDTFAAGTYKFTYHGMEILFDIDEETDFDGVVSGINGDAATKPATWDISVGGAVTKPAVKIDNDDPQSINVTNANKDFIDHRFAVVADANGIAIKDTKTSYTTEYTAWNTFTDTNAGTRYENGNPIATNGGYPIKNWGIGNDANGESEITFDDTARYLYKATDSNVPEIMFNFKLAESASLEEIEDALNYDLSQSKVMASGYFSTGGSGNYGSLSIASGSSFAVDVNGDNRSGDFALQRAYGRNFDTNEALTASITVGRSITGRNMADDVPDASGAYSVGGHTIVSRALNNQSSPTISSQYNESFSYYKLGDTYYKYRNYDEDRVYTNTYTAKDSYAQTVEYAFNGTLNGTAMNTVTESQTEYYERKLAQTRTQTDTWHYRDYVGTVDESDLTDSEKAGAIEISYAYQLPQNRTSSITNTTYGDYTTGRIYDTTLTGVEKSNYSMDFTSDKGKAFSFNYNVTTDQAKSIATGSAAKNVGTVSFTPYGFAYKSFRPNVYGSISEAEFSSIKLNVPKKQLDIQAGANQGNVITMEWSPLNLTIIGLSGVDTTTMESSRASIGMVQNALDIISETRSTFGAYQNRFEHTIRNLDNVVENTQAAESQIRDTDMPEEMVRFAKENILEQVNSTILAQANQSTSGVLSLLNS